ncbi:hypothetical protein [Streptosporangium sp. NPDC003464]
MTITESELREILGQEGGDGPPRGVTVADVDRRARRIRRRRLQALGGTVAAGLAAAMAFTLPAGGVTPVPDDLWTGVMAQPSPVLPTVSWPGREDMVPRGEIARRDYRVAGRRERLRVEAGEARIMVQVMCAGPLRRLVIRVDGGAPHEQFCGQGPEGLTYAGYWEDRTAKAAEVAERIVSVAVLPGEVDAGAMTVEELFARKDTLFDGWERQLAGAERFPLEWSVTVRELARPACRDDVRQVDPATGRVVVVRCAQAGEGGQGTG